MNKKQQKHHILISGTGRSGTSFLVKYLASLGLETAYSDKYSSSSDWFESANAGLETFINEKESNQPYVIKSPWLFHFIDEVLNNKNLKIDLVIITIRDLLDSASSRLMNENKAIYSNNNYMLDFNNPWDSFGSTPGGVIYSLGIQDQARILALGFHYLVDKLTEAEIPFVFLSFPRLVEDEGYVYDKLKDYLPKSLTREKSMKEFNKIADKNKVHFKNNELTEYNISSQKVKNNDKYLEQLLKQSNIKNMSLKEIIKNKNNMIDNLNTSLSEHSQVAKALDESNKALDESNKEVDRLKAELEIIASQMTTITNSKSWTITKPIRKVKNVFYK